MIEKAGSPHFEVEYKEKTTIFSATDIGTLIYKTMRGMDFFTQLDMAELQLSRISKIATITRSQVLMTSLLTLISSLIIL